MSTFDLVFLVELLSSKIERGEDVEEEDKEHDLVPVFGAESLEGKVLIVDFKAEPRPLHRASIPFVLMEIFEGLGLLSGDGIELRRSVEFLLDIGLSEGSASFSQRITSMVGAFAWEASLVPSELINVGQFLTLCLSKYSLSYLATFRDARYDFLVTTVSSSGLR